MIDDRQSFPREVAVALEYYVYRLIDPRNGETFYVGKGKGDRVFQHILGDLTGEEDLLSAKLRRIRDIRNSGFEVQHVIHRHGMDSKTAFEVEAALMDAYSGITNVAGGHGSSDRGVAHSKEIIERYTADEVHIEDPSIEIIVNLSATDRALYDATRFAWVVSLGRARKAEYAFALKNGIILEVYAIEKWLPANYENFPEIAEPGVDLPRYGFVGAVASDSIREKYIRKKVPPRSRGAANPIRYFNV